MPTAGISASVAITGAAVATTGEAFSLVSGKTYAIDDTTREIWDPDTAVVIKDNAVTVAAADIDDINMLHGRVTFDAGYTVTGPVTADLSYLPKTTVTEVRAGSLRVNQGVPDSSTLSTSARQRTPTTIDASGSLETFDPDLGTTVGGGKTIFELLDDDQVYVIEFNPGSGNVFRCRAKSERNELSTGAGEDDLAMGRIEWAMAAATSQEGFQMGAAWG